MKKVNIVHIYPKEMNIYGDNGNILVLSKRLKWRGIESKIVEVGVGDDIPKESHIIVGGGGQDAGQQIIASDLQKKSNTIAQLAKNGVPMLMICGMYQMFGHYFKTQTGEVIKGIEVLDIYTVAEPGRLIGNLISKTEWGEIIGYENHSGRTYLNPGCKELGKVPKGFGNSGKDQTEGAIFNSVYGSYLHGPVLAKAPEFADHLLDKALEQAGINISLKNLDNKLELFAASVAKTRPR